jgi:hypothetical protein
MTNRDTCHVHHGHGPRGTGRWLRSGATATLPTASRRRRPRRSRRRASSPAASSRARSPKKVVPAEQLAPVEAGRRDGHGLCHAAGLRVRRRRLGLVLGGRLDGPHHDPALVREAPRAAFLGRPHLTSAVTATQVVTVLPLALVPRSTASSLKPNRDAPARRGPSSRRRGRKVGLGTHAAVTRRGRETSLALPGRTVHQRHRGP